MPAIPMYVFLLPKYWPRISVETRSPIMLDQAGLLKPIKKNMKPAIIISHVTGSLTPRKGSITSGIKNTRRDTILEMAQMSFLFMYSVALAPGTCEMVCAKFSTAVSIPICWEVALRKSANGIRNDENMLDEADVSVPSMFELRRLFLT